MAYDSLCDIPCTQTVSMGAYLPERMTGRQVIEEYGSILSEETIQEVVTLSKTTSNSAGRTGRAAQGDLDQPRSEVEPLFPIRHATVYPIEENERVRQFKNILLASNTGRYGQTNGRPADQMSQLGAMMRQSHDSYARCGLDHENTNLLVDLMYSTGCSGNANTSKKSQRRGSSDNATGGGGNSGGNKGASAVVGAKSSGAGGGGVVVGLLNNAFSPRVQDLQLCEVQEKYSRLSGGKSCVVRSGSSAPATFHGNFRVDSAKRQFSTSASNKHSAGSAVDSHSTSAATPAANASQNKLPHVLFVNHGFPPEFNGGSEVYAQTLALRVLKSEAFTCDVFAREKDPYQPDFMLRQTVDEINPQLPVTLLNYPREAPYFRFVAEGVDQAFARHMADKGQPDVVHFHHLNHLSLSLPVIAKKAGAKVVYTVHDYWLMCPRGQFLITGDPPVPPSISPLSLPGSGTRTGRHVLGRVK